jgi:hypothetical protein
MSPDSEHFPSSKQEPPIIAVTPTPISGTKPRAPPDPPITRQRQVIYQKYNYNVKQIEKMLLYHKICNYVFNRTREK